DGNATTIVVQVSWSSTFAHAWPFEEVEVNVDCAWPEVIVPAGGAMLPFVAVKLTATCGTKVVTEGATLSELRVMSAVTVELSTGGIGFGEALVPRTIQ